MRRTVERARAEDEHESAGPEILPLHAPDAGDPRRDDTSEYVEAGRSHILQDKTIPDYLTIFRIHGPFLFGVTDKINLIIEQMDRLPPIVIVRLRNMTAIDATGVHALEDLALRLRESGRTLILCGAREQPAALMRAARTAILEGRYAKFAAETEARMVDEDEVGGD